MNVTEDIDIEIIMSPAGVEFSEPDHFCRDLEAKILYYGDPPDDGLHEPEQIGTAAILDARLSLALNYGWSFLDVLDAKSSEASWYRQLVEENDWTEDVKEQFGDDLLGSDLLIISSIQIDERYRGHGIGLVAVNHIMDWLRTDNGLVALDPFPEQFTDWKTPEWNPPPGVTHATKDAAFQKAVEALGSYWSRLGFWPVGETGIWALGLTKQRRTINEILGDRNRSSPWRPHPNQARRARKSSHRPAGGWTQ